MGLLVTTGVVLLVSYVGACAWWPYGRCTRCKGQGKLFSPTRTNHRNCPRCTGTGRKVRVGRRVADAFRSHS
jgi:DnaJ-class molecular chaperone